MTLQNDTLIYDLARIREWQANPDYNYNRELFAPEKSLYDMLLKWLYEVLEGLFGSRFANDYGEMILVLLFVAVVVLIGWLIYKRRPELFARSGKKAKLTYDVHEDTIYGIDFEERIRRALAAGNYKETVRLLYLQTLKQLSDRNLIDWQLFKTPTEYLYEVKAEELRTPFRELTNRFLRVRYGNFSATEELCREMQALQNVITKGGEQ